MGDYEPLDGHHSEMVRRGMSVDRQHGLCHIWLVGDGDGPEPGVIFEAPSGGPKTAGAACRPRHDRGEFPRLAGTDDGLDLWE